MKHIQFTVSSILTDVRGWRVLSALLARLMNFLLDRLFNLLKYEWGFCFCKS
jgi:hypothetical protein